MKQNASVILFILILLMACSKLDPELPNVSSYQKKGLPNVVVNCGWDNIITTPTTASLSWKIEDGYTERIKKIYFCYKDHTPDIPADTTDYIEDIMPLFRQKQDTIRLVNLHRSTRYHFSIYIETVDTAGYVPYQFLNLFTTKAVVCEDAWRIRARFRGGSSRTVRTASFSSDGKGFAGLACDQDCNEFDPSFWQYDPEVNVWIRKADFPGPPRWGYIYFSIGTKGYVGLGYVRGNNQYSEIYNDFWEYDTIKDQWRQLKDFKGMPRLDPITFSVKGKGYLLKGENLSQDYKEMWEYDPETDHWEERTCIPGERRYGPAVFAMGDKAYVMGGHDRTSPFLNDLWMYDPANDTWSRKADFPSAGRADMYVFSFDSVAVIGEGFSKNLYSQCMWQYTPSNDCWIEKLNAPCSFTHNYLNFTIGKIGYGGQPTGDFYRYDLSKDMDDCK